MRDREIEAFKSIPYHTIRAAFKHEGGVFVAVWRAKEDQVGLDPEGRLVDHGHREHAGRIHHRPYR